MVPRLWVKLHTSAELKSIRIAVPTVLGELRFGHTTSVSSGNEWVGVSCFEKCPAAVPCAMADEESGNSLKTWILCGSTLRVTRYKKTGFGNACSQMNPCIKSSFPQK